MGPEEDEAMSGSGGDSGGIERLGTEGEDGMEEREEAEPRGRWWRRGRRGKGKGR